MHLRPSIKEKIKNAGSKFSVIFNRNSHIVICEIKNKLILGKVDNRRKGSPYIAQKVKEYESCSWNSSKTCDECGLKMTLGGYQIFDTNLQKYSLEVSLSSIVWLLHNTYFQLSNMRGCSKTGLFDLSLSYPEF